MILRDAIAAARAAPNNAVGWQQSQGEWIAYDCARGSPEGVTPQFLVPRAGFPLPLDIDAADCLVSLIRDLFDKEGHPDAHGKAQGIVLKIIQKHGSA